MKIWLMSFLLITAAIQCVAQTDPSRPSTATHSDDDDDADPPSLADEGEKDHPDFKERNIPKVRMSSAFSLYMPLTRNGTATGWLPDATYVCGTLFYARNWAFMLTGNVYGRYNVQGFIPSSYNATHTFDAPDMLTLSSQRKIGDIGLIHFNATLSAEAALADSGGMASLFQTGGTWQDVPLVNRQQSKRLVSELSAGYTQALSPKTDVYIYAGYPGIPAWGPSTYMQRPSSMYNADAPLSYYRADVLQTSSGVITAGFCYRMYKVEYSSFGGKMPDENRYSWGTLNFNSRSVRVSYNPTYHWSMQASQAWLKTPELLYAGKNMNRSSVSATCVYSLGKVSYFSATALWCMNVITQDKLNTHTALVEATVKKQKKIAYMRYEWTQKSAAELSAAGSSFPANHLFNINALTAGISYELFSALHFTTTIGGQVTGYYTPKGLETTYGTTPVSGQVYIHLHPIMMNTR